MKNIAFPLFLAFASTHLWGQSSGTIDSAFANNGMFQTGVAKWDVISSVALQADGKIVAAGYAEEAGQSQFMVLRISANGSPDVDFGIDGVALAKISEWTNEASSLAIQPDGKIVVGGFARPNDLEDEEFALLRFSPEGDLDTSFHQDGIATLNIGTRDRIQSVAVLQNGKILAAGVARTNKMNFVVAQFLPNGTLDTNFGTNNGYTVTSFGTVYDVCASMTIQPDGKILLVGSTVKTNGWPDVALARYNPAGTLDMAFGTGGLVTTPFGATADVGMKVALQPDGKIVVSGLSNNVSAKSELALFRYLPNGALDASFGTLGKVRFPIGEIFSSAETVAVRPDGKILAAGCAQNTTGLDFAMSQFKPDGSVDSTFGMNGVVTTDLDNRSDGISDILFLSDGRIIAAGTGFNDDTDDTDLLMLRYLSDLYVGTIDAPQSISAPWVYPNPISESPVTLKYELNTADKVAFELISLDGKLLATLNSGERQSGQQTEELMMPSDLSDGFYLLNIRSGQGNAVVKIWLHR